MSDYLSMNPAGVRQQAESFRDASQALTEAVNSWRYMLDKGDLGPKYEKRALDMVTGFGHMESVVKNWSEACGSFGNALTQAANTVEYTDTQFSAEISKVSFDDSGELTMGGK